MKGDDVFTTGEVAKICRVANRTATKWFDSGKLRGYRIPGSADRRIPRGQLVRFLKENGMPVPPYLEPGGPLLLVMSCRQEVTGGLAALLPSWRHAAVPDGFGAGCALTGGPPACAAVLDLACGRESCRRVMEYLADVPGAPGCYALAAEDAADVRALLEAGYDGAWAWPCDLADVAAALRGEGVAA